MENYFKTLISTLVMILLVVGSANAQMADTTRKKILTRNALYVEILGTSGGFLSLNYEKITKNNISMRAGLSVTNFFSTEILSIPFSATYITQGRKKPDIEMGYGMSLLLVEGHPGVFTGPIIGFREQDRAKPGLVIRLLLTPSLYLVADNEVDFLITGGLSFGFSY